MNQKVNVFLPEDFGKLLDLHNADIIMQVFSECDINAREQGSGKTALAFESVPDTVIRWLVRKGADTSIQDDQGNTPLHIRSCIQNAGIDILIEVGAEVNVRNHQGNTPLHLACVRGNLSVARTLLCSGARADIANEEGLCALEYTLKYSHTDLKKLISISELLLITPIHPQVAFPWFFSFFAEKKSTNNDRITADMQRSVLRIGREFAQHPGKEFHLNHLYRLFGLSSRRYD